MRKPLKKKKCLYAVCTSAIYIGKLKDVDKKKETIF